MSDQAETSDVSVGGPRTLPGLLKWRAQMTPHEVARWTLDLHGQWQSESWAEVLRSVVSITHGLKVSGLREGAHVGIIAPTSAAWDDCSMAVMALRGVVVGIDAHAGFDAVQELLHLVPIDAIVIDRADRLQLLGDACPPITIVLSHSGDFLPAGCVDVAKLQQLSVDPNETEWNLAAPDDVALVVFTSGTTGSAKGISYRHGQISIAIEAILDAYPDIRSDSHLACWLPLSNLFQRIVNLCAVKRGAQTFYVSDPHDVMRQLPRIQPTVFIGVPRFFEKLYEGVAAGLRERRGIRAALASRLFAIAVEVATLRRDGKPVGAMLSLGNAMADRLVMRRVRDALGGELRYLISGSAPMPVALLTRFDAMGLPILEAYGLSECVVPLALNRPDAHRQGTVGLPLRTISLRLDNDGELLVRSVGVFEGYIGAAGVPVLDSEGYLRTGDLADIDADGFVRLIGRKSEVFKLSTGRRVAPAHVEGLLAGLPCVEHLLVLGAGRKVPLLVVSLKAGTSPQRFQVEVRRRFGVTADRLPHALQPAGAVLTWRLFGIETGELTANLKVRRSRVESRYRQALDRLEHSLNSPLLASRDLQLEMHGELLVLVGLQASSQPS